MRTFEEYQFRVKHSSITKEPDIKTFNNLEIGDNIFYIDDYNAVCANICNIRKEKGYLVFEAEDGDSSIEVDMSDKNETYVELGDNNNPVIVTTDHVKAEEAAAEREFEIILI